ncbi:MAG: IS256 family transposase [Acidobacteriota bacterium]|nr:IS256 family transposase [Acidobacteriota bacterium]
MAIRKELIDELMATSDGPLIGPDGLSKELMKALVERMMAGELNHHLGYEKHEVAGYKTGNTRNGKSKKTLKTESGEVTIAVPRDRQGTFEPQIIEKHQTRFEGFDAKIISMYALGMTVRDIQGHLHEMYGVDVSAALISEVTDSVLDEVKAWQDRPLEALYPIVYLDALMVKMRQDGKVDNRAVFTAIGINMDGEKSVLGLWVNATEGAKFWMSVLMNLKNRGMKDVFIICTEGLKGFPDAIEAVFPSTLVQTCIVHLIRASLNFVSWKERKTVAADLKAIYRAPSAEMAELALKEFRIKYPKHQVVADVWERNWQRVIPFFEFPEEIRKIIYTTNAVESLHMTLRKVTKNRGSFPSQEAAIKLIYLALRNVSKKWHSVQGWREALRQFTIRWPDRIEQSRVA